MGQGTGVVATSTTNKKVVVLERVVHLVEKGVEKGWTGERVLWGHYFW